MARAKANIDLDLLTSPKHKQQPQGKPRVCFVLTGETFAESAQLRHLIIFAFRLAQSRSQSRLPTVTVTKNEASQVS